MEPLPAEAPLPANDPKAETYHLPTTPQRAAQSTAHSTLPTNTSRGSGVTSESKDRPQQIAPDGARCLITLDVEPLERCYVIPVATGRDIVQRLESAWGFDHVQENLHIRTTRNLIWLRADMRARFDHMDWALVPTRGTLDKIASQTISVDPGAAPPYYKPCFPDAEWDYHFVLFRRSPAAFLGFHQDMEFYRAHNYPFRDFGPVKSHIHPYFAIFNAAQKEIHCRETVPGYLSDGLDSPPSRSLDYRQSLQICVRLYETWTSPASAPLKPSAPQSPPPFHQSDPLDRGSHMPKRKRQKIERVPHQVNESQVLQPSGSNNGGSRKRAREESAWTSHALPTFEQSQEDTCRVGTTAPKVECSVRHSTSVNSWVEDVKSSEPLHDPHDIHGKSMDHRLARYRSEVARRPPWGPWEGWVLEYVLI